MEYSTVLEKRARSYGVSAQYLIMADLRLLGYAENDAYLIATPHDWAANSQKVRKNREAVYNSTKFNNLIDQLSMERNAANSPLIKGNDDVRDKEDIIKELNSIANNTTQDPKLKAEILMKIADLQQMKKDQVDVGESPMQFFFPVKCYSCPLYEALVAQTSDNGDEEPVVTPDELQRIVESGKEKIAGTQMLNNA